VQSGYIRGLRDRGQGSAGGGEASVGVRPRYAGLLHRYIHTVYSPGQLVSATRGITGFKAFTPQDSLTRTIESDESVYKEMCSSRCDV
jgi:hypothetical protein